MFHLKSLFHRFGRNIVRIFSGRNLLWHAVAVVLTFIFVFSGLDWRYFEATRIPGLQAFFWPAVLLGFFLPVLGIATFYVLSVVNGSRRMVVVAFTLAQAALLGLLVSDFYKAFTGRPGPPDIFGNMAVSDTSHVFRFGFLQGGVFWGWPSSHTTVAAAMAAALVALFPGKKSVRYFSLLYAFYVGIGVSMTIHWFSDFVAGAIIGVIIGTAVGKSFRERFFETSRAEKS